MDQNKKTHWESIYETKSPQEVSWTQEVPKTSLDFIHSFNLPKSAKIIDVGGGDSNLVDHLLAEGYQNLSVLDISAKAIDRAKRRLGEKAEQVTWIVSDITKFEPETTYDCWHDRATFHFLTNGEDVQHYVKTVQQAVHGYMVIGTFSDKGPEKCSGLPVQQYNESTLTQRFVDDFARLDCRREDHMTPSGGLQNFVFCGFRKEW